MDAYGPDRYKCVLVAAWNDQINVNLLMVAMGCAEIDRGAACQVYCRELEQGESKARQDRVGMWAQGERYDSPTVFRPPTSLLLLEQSFGWALVTWKHAPFSLSHLLLKHHEHQEWT